MMSSVNSNPPEERHKNLIKAASTGNEKTIRELVLESTWTSPLDQDILRRALQSIAAYGYLPLSKFLIEHGAQVNRKRDNELSALFRAAENGRTEVVKLLLKEGAETGATDRYGRSALHLAALKGFTDIVRLLLNENTNPDARDRERRTPLIHLAAEKSSNWNEEVVALLLHKGADIEARDNTKRTPLQWAIATGDDVLSRLLLSGRFAKKADVMG
jgi:ankyrin repeat protein